MTNRDYDAAAEWAEHDMQLPTDSKTALRGQEAADFGRDLVKRSLGGRPPIEPNAAPGHKSRVRQVRLGPNLDGELDTYSERSSTKPSEIFRDSLGVYLDPELVAFAEQNNLTPLEVLRRATREYLEAHRTAS